MITIIGCPDCGSHQVISPDSNRCRWLLPTGVWPWETAWCQSCARRRPRIVWVRMAWVIALFLAFVHPGILVKGIPHMSPAGAIVSSEAVRAQPSQRSVLAPNPSFRLPQVVADEPLQQNLGIEAPIEISSVEAVGNKNLSTPVAIPEEAVMEEKVRQYNVTTASPDPTEVASRVSEEDNQRVLQSIESWRASWAAQNVAAYISHYIPDFRPESGKSHDAWLEDRKVKLLRPKAISVEIEILNIQQVSRQRWVVTLRQQYQSELFKDVVVKTFYLIKIRNDYLIEKEAVRPLQTIELSATR